MADNVVANAGSGGATFATDEDVANSRHVPYCKIMYGADGTFTIVSTSNGFPIQLVSGQTVAVTNAGTFVVQENGAALTALQLIDDAVYTDGTGTPSKGIGVMGTDGTNPQLLSVTSAGLLNIADGSGSITVDGTVAATQSGTWTVTGTGGTFPVTDSGGSLTVDAPVGTPVFVRLSDGTAAITTLPVSLASVPSHAVTNAGTFAVQVDNTVTVASHAVTNAGTFAVQVDGNALTALQLIDDVVFADDAAYTLGTSKGVMMMGFAGTQSVDANDAAALACTTAGALRVNVENTLTVSSHAVTNAGTFAVQVDGSALTALQLIDDCIFTDDAAFTPGTSKLAVVGAQADETSTDSVDEGDAGALRMTLDRKLMVVAQPHTAGGCSIFRTLDLDETEEDVKTSAGQVYGIFAINTTNAMLYLKLYNATAANVTVGSTTPVATFPVPANNDTDGAGFALTLPFGVAFDTAISAAATTAVGDADTGAPGANALIVQIFYK